MDNNYLDFLDEKGRELREKRLAKFQIGDCVCLTNEVIKGWYNRPPSKKLIQETQKKSAGRVTGYDIYHDSENYDDWDPAGEVLDIIYKKPNGNEYNRHDYDLRHCKPPKNIIDPHNNGAYNSREEKVKRKTLKKMYANSEIIASKN